MAQNEFHLPKKEIERFCRQNHIKKLSLFGSALTEKFNAASDIDLLVEFEKDHIPGLLSLARMERELSLILGGRKVDLRTSEDLSRYFRKDVVSKARVEYAQ